MRNPIKDQVAIVGIGTTGYSRSNGDSPLSLALQASTAAIRDAGLTAADIDGIVATSEPGAPGPQQIASALATPNITHFTKPTPVVMFSLIDGMNAVFSGACDTVLVVFPMLRLPWNSRSAANDPFRRRFATGVSTMPENISMATGYTAWASRYLHETNSSRDVFASIAVNGRSNAVSNPLAVLRTPMTFEDYYAARMIREPFCMLDMDMPVDGADAFVLTTAERAATMPNPPVYIHAASVGMIDRNDEDQLPSLARHGQHVVVEALKAKSDIWLDDIDLFYPYDGFTVITVGWFENVGWCKFGEAERFLKEHAVGDDHRIIINGKVPVNTHGGSLSEGATRGTGHVREAVTQLRHAAGDRQVPGVRTALVTPGGFFFNSQGLILRN